MAVTKSGTQFDINTGEIFEKKAQTPSIMKHKEVTTSYGRKRVRIRSYNNDPSMTDQSQAQETDVNYIMKRLGNDMRLLPEHQKSVSDLTDLPTDLASAYLAIQEAEETFMTLPARLRSKFDNDPQKLVQFLNDPKNNEEAIHYGLKVKAPDEFIPQTRSNDRVVEQPSGSAVGKKTKPQTPPKTDDSSET